MLLQKLISHLLKYTPAETYQQWWHNTAGVICGAQEYLHGSHATYENLIKTIDETMPQSTYDNLVEAQKKGITPCENVYRKCESIIYGEN